MTKYDKSIIDQTFQLYASGIPIERISKKTGIAKITIYRWIKKYNWKDRNAKIEEKVRKEVDETVTEIKKRQHMLIKGLMARYSEQLQAKDVKVTSNELISALKHELLLFGEAETTIGVKDSITAQNIADLYEELYGNSNKTTKRKKD